MKILRVFLIGSFILSGQTLVAQKPKVAEPLKLSQSCQAPPNQMGGFIGPIPQTTNLLADATFSKDQRKAVQAAVDTWNRAGLNLGGWYFFELSFVDVPATLAHATSLDCGEKYGTPNFMYLVAVKDGDQWQKLNNYKGNSEGNYSPGINYYCRHPISKELSQQVVLINLNTVGVQLQSVVLHELGHALGLGHSCDSSRPKKSRDDYVSCDKISGGEYYNAIMFPSLLKKTSSQSFPQMKHDLNANDLIRLQCLYGPK